MNLKKNLLMCSFILCGGVPLFAQLHYPATRKVDVTDDYFGTKVADPYRWLEDDNSPETAQWVQAQNSVTRSYLDKIPFRSALKQRLTTLANHETMSVPFIKNGKYYLYRNNGLQNQSVLYETSSLGGEESVLLDPNKLSSDGTVALKALQFSKDGKYLAYVISRSGSDWNEIYVMDVASRHLLDDHIVWAKFTGAAWLGNGFFYSAYDAPADGKGLSSKNEFQKVYYHRIGTPQSDDSLVYHNDKYPLRFYSMGTSDDERFAFLYESDGEGNAVYVKDLKKGSDTPFVCIASNIRKDNGVVDSDDRYIYIHTNDGAPKYKLLAIDANSLDASKARTVIPESGNVMESAQMADGKFIVSYIENVSNHAYLYSAAGERIREIKLPTIGSAGFWSDRQRKEVFYSFNSYTFPGTVYRYDIDKNASSVIFTPKVDFVPEDYITEQVSYPSKDGTMINMFLTHRKGMKLNGKNPVLLYGYGGFNISLSPSFSSTRIPFIENGGIYAVASLRGGGEFGEDWHQAGTKLHKQNVFDDFISAAEYLVAKHYTSPAHIAINGGSNGGLLVGACLNQRPDLFRVAVPQVGVMDMLRYHKFTVGWNWASDYGRSDDSKEMFEYLYKYSPLHSIKTDGTRYPAVLITTGDHDDRVVPAHSFKFAATLQAAPTGNQPKLIRIDSKAGHGSGKPISKIIDEQADIYSFIMYNLGMKLK